MHRARLVIGCSALVLVAARAQPVPAQDAEQAPAEGAQAPAQDAQQAAAEDARQRAEALFAAGSELFQQWRFPEAEQKYREALTHAQHPVIVLYLARALDRQGDLVQAYETLQQALARGPASLPPEDARLAVELRADLESRLAQLEAHCDQPGTEVSLDGQPWFTAPGPARRMVRPGQHVLVARKAGYFPVTEVVSLIPGKQSRIDIRMSPDAIRVERRWPARTPWIVTGGGVAASALGGVLLWWGSRDYAAFADLLDACSGMLACEHVPTRRRDRGRLKEVLGTGALVAGGAAVVLGLAGVLFNQPIVHRSEPAGGLDIELAPLISDDASGLSARIRF
jgi:tetratricopeptide (TPR) repeat protein